MNEVFSKLARDAMVERASGFREFDANLFAELIVRECAQVCNNIDAEYEGEDVLATWCATAIREHFGVEE